MRLQIHGSQGLKRKLDSLGSSMTGQTMVRALTAGALLIQNEAKRRAPYQTGNLRRSIHIGGHDDLNPEGANIIGKGPSPVPEPEIGETRASVYVGTDVEYAGWVELGTSKMTAQPYLRPAADTQGDAIRGEAAAALRDLVRAAVR